MIVIMLLLLLSLCILSEQRELVRQPVRFIFKLLIFHFLLLEVLGVMSRSTIRRHCRSCLGERDALCVHRKFMLLFASLRSLPRANYLGKLSDIASFSPSSFVFSSTRSLRIKESEGDIVSHQFLPVVVDQDCRQS